MARVAGVDLPKDKRVDIAITYIFGVGRTLAKEIMEKVSGTIEPATRVKDLTEAQVGLLSNIITKDYKVEGELRRDLQSHLRHYIEINSYRGLRHRRNLPVRGQRTKTNARTRRGRRRTIGSAKPGDKAAPAGK